MEEKTILQQFIGGLLIKGWRPALLSVLLLGSAASANAQLALPIWQQLKQLVDSGRSQEAYELGVAHQEELEGTPDFDYFFGMAAVDAGQVAEGAFALERVLFIQPDFQTAKLELARAYYLLGQYPLARQHFKAVLDVSPPPSVIERINRFMLLMDKAEQDQQSKVLAYFEVLSGHDNNTNFAPASETFNSPTLGQGVLSSDGTQQSNWYNDTLAGVGYYVPVDKRSTLYGRVDLADHNVNTTHKFDSSTYTVQAGMIHKLDPDNTLSAQLIHQQHFVDDARYRELNGLAGNWMHLLDRTQSVQFGVNYLNFVYNDLNNKDAEEYNFSLGYNRQIPVFGASLLQARLSYGETEPNNSNPIAKATTEREFWGLSLAHKVPVGPKVVVTSTLAYLNSEYNSDDLLFQVTRQDDLVSFDIEADWRWSESWRLRVAAGWREQDSNIEIYDYDRAYGSVGVRYELY